MKNRKQREIKKSRVVFLELTTKECDRQTVVTRLDQSPLYLFGGTTSTVSVAKTTIDLGSDDEAPSDESEEEEAQDENGESHPSQNSLAIRSTADHSPTSSPSGSGTRPGAAG